MKPPKPRTPDGYLISEFQKGLERWSEKSAQEHAKKGEIKWNVLRISQIGDCQAAITRDWLGQKGIEDGHLDIARMYDGSCTHTAMREIFALSDIKLMHEERQVRKDYKVKLEDVVDVPVTLIGHQDNAFKFNNQEIVVDYKKASVFSYEKMEDGEISDGYYDQMQGYLDITKCKLGILFVKSVDGRVNAITIERDPLHFKGVLERLARIALLRKRKEIGRRDFVQGLAPCTYCRHRIACWSVDASLEDRGTVIDQSHPDFDKIRTAIEVKQAADEAALKAEEYKSDARALALSLFKKLGVKKLHSPVGSITWTSFKRKTIRLVDAKKQEALKEGFAEESESRVEYPLFAKPRAT